MRSPVPTGMRFPTTAAATLSDAGAGMGGDKREDPVPITAHHTTSSSQCRCWVSESCPTLCDPMNCSTPGLLSITNSWSSLKLMSIESVMPSSHLILCRPLSSCPQSLPASESFPMSQLFRTYFYPNMRVLKVNILRKSHLSNYMFLCLIKHMFLKFNKNLGTWGILITPFISQFVINSTHVVWGFSVSLQRVTSP